MAHSMSEERIHKTCGQEMKKVYDAEDDEGARKEHITYWLCPHCKVFEED